MTIVGIGLLVLSMVAYSLIMTIEEYTFIKYQVTVSRLLGLESLFGILTMLMVCIVASTISCFDPSICNPMSYFEDPVMAIKDMLA